MNEEIADGSVPVTPTLIVETPAPKARKPRTVKNKTVLVGGAWLDCENGSAPTFTPHALQPNPPTNDLSKAVAFFKKNVVGETQFVRKMPGTLRVQEQSKLVGKFA